MKILTFLFRRKPVEIDVLNRIEHKLQSLTMKVSELATVLTEVGNQLGKASVEINAKLDALASSDPDISPEGVAAIERVRSIAQALDDIVPDVPADESAPAPEVTPVPNE